MAREFNGTDQALQSASAIDLSSTNVVSFAFWHYTAAWPSSAVEVIAELSDNYNLVTDSFVMDAFDTGAAGLVGSLAGNVDYNTSEYTPPSTSAWHHYVFIFDTSQATQEVFLYIDGSLATRNGGTQFNNSNNFGNRILYFMARGAASLWRDGRLADVAIWKSSLSSGNISTLAGGNPNYPNTITPAADFYWKLCGTTSPEPATLGSVALTLVGSPTQVDHPAAISGSCATVLSMSGLITIPRRVAG